MGPADPAPAPRSAALDWSLSLGAAALVLLVLLPTVPREVLQGDPGEFQLAAAIGGLAHPTGYPLYLLIGWAWTKLGAVGSPAYAMNLLSALFAAATAGVTARLVLALAPQAPAWLALPAAAWSAAFLSFSPTYWSQSIVAEVYTQHCLLWGALALATLGLAQRPRRWWVIGLLAGLGLAHHRLTMLYLPAVVGCLWLARPKGLRRHHLTAALALLLLPLVFYVYIPLRAPETPYLSLTLAPGDTLSLYEQTPAGFLRFISGQAFESALTGTGVMGRARTALDWGHAEMAPALLVLAGALWLARTRKPAAVLLVGALLVNVAFNLLYNIGDIHVFYLPVYQTAAVLAGVAVAGWGSSSHTRSAIAGLVLLALAVSAVVRAPAARESALASIPHAPEGLWQSAFAVAPQDAIVLSNDRNEIVPMWYHQYAESQRPDLLGLFPLISTEPEYSHIGALAADALQTGRPVCLVKEMPGLEVGFQPAPSSPPLQCLAGLWTAPEPQREQRLADDVLLLGYDAPAEPLTAGEAFPVSLYWQAVAPLAAPYSTYVHVLDGDGAPVWTGSDHRPGGDYLPAPLWLPGQVIRDEHVLTIPADAAPGEYRLLVGMYEYPSLMGHGDAIVLGSVEVAPAGR